MFRSGRLLPLMLLLAVASTWAEEGRIPIFEPIVLDGTSAEITGQYVVTRNIQATGGDAVIQVIGDPTANQSVEIDLNGFTLTGHTGNDAVVLVEGLRNFTIRNGSLIGKNTGSVSETPGQVSGDVLSVTGTSSPEDHAVIEDLKTSGGDEQIQLIEVNNFVIRRNLAIGIFDVSGSGIEISGVSELTGIVEDNVLRDTQNGVDVPGVTRSLLVRDNRIHNRVEDSVGIFVKWAKSLILSGNNIVGGGSAVLLEDVEQCKISNNVASEGNYSGYELRRVNDCLITHNVGASKTELKVDEGATGLYLESSNRNHIDANDFGDNFLYGIEFDSASKYNTYGRNTLRGNMGGAGGTACSTSISPCGAPAVCDNTGLDPAIAPAANRSFEDNLRDAPWKC